MSIQYEYIIAGGGLSGLSLAYSIINNPLLSGKILIADKKKKKNNDRTWGFWDNKKSPFNNLVYRKYSRLLFARGKVIQVIESQNFSYNVIRGIDLYAFLKKELRADARVDFAYGTISELKDTGPGAELTLDGALYTGRWLFNSTHLGVRSGKQKKTKPPLYMQFKGWVIETPEAAFDTETVSFLDFRTPQKKGTRFFYVLPYQPHKALVEYTCFVSSSRLFKEYKTVMEAYIKNILKVKTYRIIEEEQGLLPLYLSPRSRRQGRHILRIGNHAGHLKPTTGYSFKRIQEDSRDIVGSLVENGHPFRTRKKAGLYRLIDALMVWVMSRCGEQVGKIFAFLFRYNPISRIFRFLDERSGVGECYELIKTLPPDYFIKAIIKEMQLKE